MTQRRVAVVTGCGKSDGIGAAIARRLAHSGHDVVISDILPSGESDGRKAVGGPVRGSLSELAAELAQGSARAEAFEADLRDERQADRLVAFALERFGRLDVLINNASAPHGLDRADIADVPTKAWNEVMWLNVGSAFVLTRAASVPMRSQRWGRVVNISSSAAMFGAQKMGAYSASKAALLGLTRSAALDLAPWNVTVNAVCPGAIRTSRATSTALRQGYANPEDGLAARARAIPLGRMGEPGDVAGLVQFLVSDQAEFLTAQTLLLDGGKGGIPADYVPPVRPSTTNTGPTP